MTLESLATGINEATGWTGLELQAATFIAAMVFADVCNKKAIGDYFDGRLKATVKLMEKRK